MPTAPKPSAETAVEGYKRTEVNRGPTVPFAVTSLGSSAIESTDLAARRTACRFDSLGKAGNKTYAYVSPDDTEIMGFVQWVSSNTTSLNSQDVPDVCGVMVRSGTVAVCAYDTAQAPAKGDRVIMTSTSGHFGEVRISTKVDSGAGPTGISSEGDWVARNVVVIELDTTNVEAICMIL